MNKKEIYDYLDKKNISYIADEHIPVYNMEDLHNITLSYPYEHAKNLFVRDDKRLSYYLICVKGDKRVNLKEFRKQHQTRPLTFCSSDELMELLCLIPGAVTPLGLLNDKECKVSLYIDKDLLEMDVIGIHPNDNSATVWMKTKDIISLVLEHGNNVNIVEI